MKAAALLLCPVLLAQAPAAPKGFKLSNGLQIWLLEDHDQPLVRAELFVDLGLPGTEALPRDLGFSLLRKGGSGHRSHAEFNRALDGLGLDLRQELMATAIRWSLLARSRDQDLALGLLADLALRPAFDGSVLEQERGRYYDRLRKAPPLVQAEEAFRWAMLGTAPPTEESLGALTTKELGAWHRRVLRPERATLVLHGDLDLAQARQLATLSFGSWSADAPLPAAAPPAPREQPFAVALSGAPTEVRAGLGAHASAPFLFWLRRGLAGTGVELDANGGLITAKMRGGVGESAPLLQSRLVDILKGLHGSAADAFADEEAQIRLLPLHPAEWVHQLAVNPHLTARPGTEGVRGWVTPIPKVFLWIGDPAAFAQSATPKREAKSR